MTQSERLITETDYGTGQKPILDDIVQLGAGVPAIMVVNGRGEVRRKGIGYQKGMLEEFFEAIKRNTNGKSKKIEK